MKALASRAIAPRSAGEGWRMLGGTLCNCASAGIESSGRMEALAAIPMKRRRCIVIVPPWPLNSICGAASRYVEYRSGREGAIFGGQPRHQRGQFLNQNEAGLR